jgi:hypothetical protein
MDQPLEDKIQPVLKSFQRMHPQGKRCFKLVQMTFQTETSPFSQTLFIFYCRKKNVQLCLSESYFYNMHLISPYFAIIVLNRLKNAYISPQIEMQTDTAFFRICTVSTNNVPYPPV